MKPFGFCSISNNKMINNRSETHEINININEFCLFVNDRQFALIKQPNEMC